MSDEENLNEGEGIANLRKQYEELVKEVKGLKAENSQYKTKERASTVAEILKAKGVPASAAKLYSDEDTSEDAVSKWLEDYADVFHLSSSKEDDSNSQAVRVVSNASHANRETQAFDNAGQVIGNPDELLQLIQNSSYDDLVKQGLMPKV